MGKKSLWKKKETLQLLGYAPLKIINDKKTRQQVFGILAGSKNYVISLLHKCLND